MRRLETVLSVAVILFFSTISQSQGAAAATPEPSVSESATSGTATQLSERNPR